MRKLKTVLAACAVVLGLPGAVPRRPNTTQASRLASSSITPSPGSMPGPG